MDAIPKSVTEFAVNLLKDLSDPGHCLSSLPTTLKTLKIAKFAKCTVTDYFDFSSLVNLKTLIISTLDAENEFSTLPTGLHKLETLEKTTASVEAASKLPRLLRSIEGIEWTGSHHELAKHFPPFAAPYFPNQEEYKDALRARLRSAF